MAAMAECTGGRLIAIDGKTIRRSFNKADNKAAIHVVSAWSETNHLVLGQVATEAKSNEITAIPDTVA
jgi:predicted transposase YbfD/YdcC